MEDVTQQPGNNNLIQIDMQLDQEMQIQENQNREAEE